MVPPSGTGRAAAVGKGKEAGHAVAADAVVAHAAPGAALLRHLHQRATRDGGQNLAARASLRAHVERTVFRGHDGRAHGGRLRIAFGATVTLAAPVSDQELKDAVTEAGYEVVSIQ